MTHLIKIEASLPEDKEFRVTKDPNYSSFYKVHYKVLGFIPWSTSIQADSYTKPEVVLEKFAKQKYGTVFKTTSQKTNPELFI